MLNHAAQSGRHALSERGHDLYETPVEATAALIEAEGDRMPHCIWEPACGRGAIVNVLRGVRRIIIASDLVDYSVPITPPGYWGRNFLDQTSPPLGCDGGGIVTNPPYQLADQFVRHAIRLVPYVAMLLRLAFLESVRRTDILEGGQLARVHVFRNRLPMLHRDGWAGPRNSSATAFAWFVWERDHKGPAILNRVSWKPAG